MTSDNLRDAFRAFTTTCALITTDGAQGPNVMAAEWTFNISYRPFLILVSIDPGNRTHDLILESKEFGVNLVTEEQVTAMGLAGHYSKADTDKLSSELFETYPAQKIRAPMIQGALLNAECRLVETHVLGDHTAFVGEVVSFRVNPEARPLILHHGSHRLGERLVRTPGLIVSVTPMRAGPGSTLAVQGELTAHDRGATSVRIRLRSGNGDLAVEGTTLSDSDGSFSMELIAPTSLSRGSYRVEAATGELRGQARLEIT